MCNVSVCVVVRVYMFICMCISYSVYVCAVCMCSVYSIQGDYICN